MIEGHILSKDHYQVFNRRGCRRLHMSYVFGNSVWQQARNREHNDDEYDTAFSHWFPKTLTREQLHGVIDDHT